MNTIYVKLKPFAKSIFVFFAIVLIGFYFYFGFKGFDLSKIWKSLYHSDFYINYEGGFVRRGLDGEIIYLLAKTFHINSIFIQKIYNLIFFVVFGIMMLYFICKYKPPFFALFSTSVLLLYVFYIGRGLRKDHILMFFFFLSCFEMLKSKRKIYTILVINVLFIIATLVHELFFIISFFPTVLLLNNFTFGTERKSLNYIKPAISLLPATLVFLYIFFFGLGTVVEQQAILTSWKELGITTIAFNSGIFDRSLYIWELGFTRNQYISFLGAIVLHFIFMIVIISNDLKNKELKKTFYALIILQYAVLLALSAVAKDFSRWIFLCNLTILIPIYILKKQVDQYPAQQNDNYFSFLKKVSWVPYILFFINTMPHSGWNFNDYIVYNPVNVVYKIISNKHIL